MSNEFHYAVLLSHNLKDKPRVRKLAKRLKAAGVQMEAGLRLWLNEWGIQAGDIIALKVDEGLEQSRVLLPKLLNGELSMAKTVLSPAT